MLLLGDGTKAVGINDWAFTDMNGFASDGVADASETLWSSSLSCFSIVEESFIFRGSSGVSAIASLLLAILALLSSDATVS